MKSYDAIVVGGGNGGLACALMLQKSGKRVLVVEKHNICGGAAQSFKRGRFEFDASLWFLWGAGDSSSGNPGLFKKALMDLEVFDKIDFHEQKELYYFQGMGMLIPNGMDPYIKSLQAIFPNESERIEAFQNLIEGLNEEFSDLYQVIEEGGSITEERFPLTFKYGNRSAQSLMDEYLTHPMLKVIQSMWIAGLVGTPTDRTCPIMLGYSNARSGNGYGVGDTAQSIANTIQNTFMDLGGVLKLNTTVSKIMVEDGSVKGIITKDGEVYTAPVVISNAGRINTYADLLGTADAPAEEYANLKVSPVCDSMFYTYVGLDCDAKELGMDHSTMLYTDPNAKPAEGFDDSGWSIDYVDSVGIKNYNFDIPGYSPEGTTTLCVGKGQWPDAWLNLPPEEYYPKKLHYSEMLLNLVEQAYPGFLEHVEEFEIASPLTFMRYLNDIGGAFYRESQALKDLIANKLKARSEIKGLYFCGASLIAGGYGASLRSGGAVGKLVLKDMKDGIVPAQHEFAKLPGIEEVFKEIEVLKRTNVDYRSKRGYTQQMIDRYHPSSIEFKVASISEETPTSKRIRLVSTNGYLPPFISGKFINLSVVVNGVHTSRAYTIASSDAERSYYEIIVKESPDGFVSDYMLHTLKVGDVLNGSAPSGNFYRFDAVHGKKHCLIAGGSGITPFLSMIQSDFDRMVADRETVLIYGCNKEDDIIAKEQLEDLAKKVPGLRIVPVISSPSEGCKMKTGFITPDLIREVLGTPEEYTYFICGPQAMYKFVIPGIRSLGVPERKIRCEVQTPQKHPSNYPGWPQNISETDVFTITLSDGRIIPAAAGQTIMASLEKNGISVESNCRSGECSMCRSRLLSGEVFHPGLENLRKSDMKWGYIHPCVTYPISDITLWVPNAQE